MPATDGGTVGKHSATCCNPRAWEAQVLGWDGMGLKRPAGPAASAEDGPRKPVGGWSWAELSDEKGMAPWKLAHSQLYWSRMPAVPQQILLFPEDEEKRRRARKFGTPEFWQDYREYIRSPEWRKLRKQVLSRAGGRCERCPRAAVRLHVHHKTYERFRQELLGDLEALCSSCHDEADRERERQNEKKFEEACEEGRYKAARDTYLEKKYGEDWQMHYWHDPDAYDDEFDSWLDRKREEEYDRYR